MRTAAVGPGDEDAVLRADDERQLPCQQLSGGRHDGGAVENDAVLRAVLVPCSIAFPS